MALAAAIRGQDLGQQSHPVGISGEVIDQVSEDAEGLKLEGLGEAEGEPLLIRRHACRVHGSPPQGVTVNATGGETASFAGV